MLLFQILALFHISLGQQLNLYWVHKVPWLTSCTADMNPLVKLHRCTLFHLYRSECWLRCSPPSLGWFPLMTYGERSGTSCSYRCRLVQTCCFCQKSSCVIFTVGLLCLTFIFCYQFTAPFLHIGVLLWVTAVSWLVAGYVVRKERMSKCWTVSNEIQHNVRFGLQNHLVRWQKRFGKTYGSSLDFQVMVLLVYIIVLVAVYLAPLTFTCPCIMDKQRLQPRPDIIGRRGAPMVSWGFGWNGWWTAQWGDWQHNTNVC